MNRLLLIAANADEALVGLGFAQVLALEFDILVLTGAALADSGAGVVFEADVESVSHDLAKSVAELSAPYSHVAALSNMTSKDLLARVAGYRRCGMVSDVIAIESPTAFRRPIVAGSMIETVEVLELPVVMTFRPAGFPVRASSGNSEVQSVSLTRTQGAERVAVRAKSGGRPDLAQAKVVVSGGQPLKDAETFERVIGGLADTLGGAVGATRAAVDKGIAPNELQVGQTGKIVAPDLYIAAGVSGSTQHMAGIKDSKVIVAINKDPDAPIFEIADYGLVADLFEAIPQLQEKLEK